jgi:hypothetical protein
VFSPRRKAPTVESIDAFVDVGIMESRWNSVRAEWERDVAVERSRARLAIGALGATALVHVLLIGVAMTSSLEALGALTSVELLLLIATAIVYLRWLARAVSLASTMSATRLKWTGSAAVWAFFMPIVGLWRPFQVVRDVHDALAPDAVPEPAPRPVLDGSGGYRHVPMKAAPPPLPVPHASIGLWWALFVGARVLNYGDVHVGEARVLGDVVSIASAMLGLFVVRAIDGRIHERLRRVRHASDEELEAWELRA